MASSPHATAAAITRMLRPRAVAIAGVSSTPGSLGGNYYSVVVMCQQPGGRESEVEFVFKFGI